MTSFLARCVGLCLKERVCESEFDAIFEHNSELMKYNMSDRYFYLTTTRDKKAFCYICQSFKGTAESANFETW